MVHSFASLFVHHYYYFLTLSCGIKICGRNCKEVKLLQLIFKLLQQVPLTLFLDLATPLTPTEVSCNVLISSSRIMTAIQSYQSDTAVKRSLVKQIDQMKSTFFVLLLCVLVFVFKTGDITSTRSSKVSVHMKFVSLVICLLILFY